MTWLNDDITSLIKGILCVLYDVRPGKSSLVCSCLQIMAYSNRNGRLSKWM